MLRTKLAVLNRLRTIYHDYPTQFWVLMGASFIDIVGNALIFPFFALFITERFGVGMTQVGMLFVVFSAAGIVGSTIGGALTDRFGRKPVFLLALITSAIGNLVMVMVPDYWMLFPVGAALGIVGSIGGPAAQAMIADLLPEEKRSEGFAIWRIEFNIAVMFGPIIGGLMAGYSYVLLFSVDAATSLITAALLLVVLKESRPEKTDDEPEESFVQTLRGYGRVFRDGAFMAFALLNILVWIVYFQMNTTMGVYLRDAHDLAEQNYGLLLSINALMVVVLQFSITRTLNRRGVPPMLVLALGTLLYAIGFGMFGFVSTYVLFIVAMAIITVGEMVFVPVGQSLAAGFAQEDMRGRYMAVFGFGFAIASGGGTLIAGQIIDHLGHEWVWFLAGITGFVAALGYVWMHRHIAHSERELITDSAPDEVPASAAEGIPDADALAPADALAGPAR